eukprot:scaffold203992_cov33-Tisochrysis_lutea.AAC.2
MSCKLLRANLCQQENSGAKKGLKGQGAKNSPCPCSPSTTHHSYACEAMPCPPQKAWCSHRSYAWRGKPTGDECHMITM